MLVGYASILSETGFGLSVIAWIEVYDFKSFVSEIHVPLYHKYSIFKHSHIHRRVFYGSTFMVSRNIFQ